MPTDSSRVLTFPSPNVSNASRVSVAPDLGDEALLGPSAAIARVWSQIRRVAPYFRAAIVTGEPGCGAEAVGRALHVLSPVSRFAFTALDASQAEHAFRSGAAPHPSAEGFLFLSDLEHLSQESQRALLRKVKLRNYPLRVVGAAVADLRASVSAGKFSAELAESLAAIRISLPPLRDRREDIPLLAGHFAQRVGARLGTSVPRFDSSFQEAAVAFEWPGNLVQLEAMLVHMLSEECPDSLTEKHFHEAASTATIPPPQAPPPPARMVPLEDVVQEHIRAVLVASNGNKLRAAEVLGISRSTLYRMLDSYSANQFSADQSLPIAS